MLSNRVITKFLGNGPYPFPYEKITDYLELHCTNDVCVSISKCPTEFDDDMIGHSHDSYEFIIPYTAMPNVYIDKHKLTADANTLISINPYQPHGPGCKMQVDCIIGVHMDKNYLAEISYQVNNSCNFIFDNISLFSSEQIKLLMQYFINEDRVKQTGYKFVLESLSSQISVNLLRSAKYSSARRTQEKKLSDSKSMHRVIEFLRENYCSNDYSSEEIAKLANLSTYHFIRAFKQYTGKTPYEYLMDVKIEKAMEMLKNNNFSITEVCFSSGFTNPSHFSTVFKKRIGITPTEFRSQLV